NSGNSVTTSMRRPVLASPVRCPIEFDVPGGEIDFHDPIFDERNPVLSLAADDDDVSGRRRAEVIDSAEHFTFAATSLDSFANAPVVLARGKFRHFAARDAYFGSDVQPRLLRRLDPSELRKHAFTGESPILDCHRRPF